MFSRMIFGIHGRSVEVEVVDQLQCSRNRVSFCFSQPILPEKGVWYLIEKLKMQAGSLGQLVKEDVPTIVLIKDKLIA